MRLGHRAGSSISFIDSFSEETVLKVECEVENKDLFSYRLYDSSGTLVAEVEAVSAMPDGIEVRTAEGELLLRVSPELGAAIDYRLYSSKGALITCSDGARTQIFGGLQIVGNRTHGRPPARRIEPHAIVES